MPSSVTYRSELIKIGSLSLGGDAPVRIQSMTNTSSMDIDASYRQVMALYEAGCELIRLTARNVREAGNIGKIRTRLENAGVYVPLAADIHFNPKVAEAAASIVQKIRINPGNYLDNQYYLSRTSGKKSRMIHQEEREAAVIGLIEICRRHQTAIRVGVNHGSLSERILNQYGNTAEGMVASAMEFLEICRNNDFNKLVVSLKSSHVKTMIRANLGIVESMTERGMHYPLHLGVTEAGEGQDGRIRSAAGIGPLLAMGLGDTIRVSLTEDPLAEIPVARKLVEVCAAKEKGKSNIPVLGKMIDGPARQSNSCGVIGGKQPPAVIGIPESTPEDQPRPDLFASEKGVLEDRQGMRYYIKENESLPGIANLSVKQTETGDDCAAMLMAQGGNIKEILQRIHHHIDKNPVQPLLLKLDYQEPEKELFLLSASAELSLLMMIGYGNAFWLTNRGIAHADIVFGILQATGLRISGTEYISCPGCGRTTFDIQNTLKNIKEHTRGMKNTRIAVMGCIVNGPGEMAGADYGYVGEGNGKVSLYQKGKRLKKNIPEEDAIKELLSIIKKERAD